MVLKVNTSFMRKQVETKILPDGSPLLLIITCILKISHVLFVVSVTSVVLSHKIKIEKPANLPVPQITISIVLLSCFHEI